MKVNLSFRWIKYVIEKNYGDFPEPRLPVIFPETQALARRLSDTAIRFAVTEADIIENTVRKNLPEAPFQDKPKRRMRFSA